MFDNIKVTYKSTNRAYEANRFLNDIKKYPIIGCDLETASKYTSEQIEECKQVITSPDYDKSEKILAQSILNVDGLSHPAHCTVTHGIIGVSESESYVFLLDNDKITDLFFNFLIETEQTQIWHNATFDFKHIYYHTGKFPKVYEDTQILSKCLINHVNNFKAKTGLKELAGTWYGDWAISEDNFDISKMYEDSVIKYAATDGCSTLKLWNYINDECDKIDEEIRNEFYETNRL